MGDGDGAPAAERMLLERLGDCLRSLARFDEADRERTCKVLDTLITGMERDLRRFPRGEANLAAPPVALQTMDELDEHCYLAAGCVGEYWTLMSAAHVPSMRKLQRPDFVARGVRLGKALQLINVIRDAPADLRDGRCYLPLALLSMHGLTPESLRDPLVRRRARPILDELRHRALTHIDAALPYVLAIPRSELRLRLAALWPLWIGLATLARLREAADPLDPKRPIKISRAALYRLLAESTMTVASDGWLGRAHRRRREAAT
jgi:farnesyl-diphosphate farnesyltransferase